MNRITDENIQQTFVMDGKFDVNDFETSKTVIQVKDPVTNKFVEVLPQKGSMTVTVDENNIIKAVASFIGDDAKQYNLTFYTEFARVRIPYDNESYDVDYTFEAGSYVETVDFLQGWGMVHLRMLAHDNSAVASFYFYANSYDPVIGVPEGTYLINKTAKVGSAHPSSGVDVNRIPLESFFCWMIYDEMENAMYYDMEGLYCLVDGSITIKNEGGQISVEVDALNSHDMSVKLHYKGAVVTPVENTPSQDTLTEKRLMNGQLYIIRNGETYTVMGVKL